MKLTSSYVRALYYTICSIHVHSHVKHPDNFKHHRNMALLYLSLLTAVGLMQGKIFIFTLLIRSCFVVVKLYTIYHRSIL